jgi:pyruvate kinase
VVGARALVAFTMTGETARRLARYRSPIPLLAFTTEPATRSQLALTWGVETFLVPTVGHTDGMVRQVEAALLEMGRCEKGDKVVIVAGSPPGTPAGPTPCACTVSAIRPSPDAGRSCGCVAGRPVYPNRYIDITAALPRGPVRPR